VLRLIALLLPLALDTFAVAAALGVAGLSPSQRLRTSFVLAGFEAGMPLVGVGVGQALGNAVGSLADYVAGAALVALGAFLIFRRDDDEDQARMLARAHGVAIVALGVSISLDELAVGFSIGLLRLPLAWAIVLIAAQAFLAAQLGVRFGGRVREPLREHLEQAAGLALIALGAAFLVARHAS
jgi:putative Mn2+ efflux pump MntP